jgi:hypothetical protein
MGALGDSKGVTSRLRFPLVVLGAALFGCSSAEPGSVPNNTAEDGAGVGGGGAVAIAGASSVGGAGATTGGSGNAGASAGSAGSAPVSSLPGCALKFPYQDEPLRGTWLGGDSAYSTPLTPTIALWSFQDTIIGKHGATTRDGAGFIANSMAYVKCENGVGSIEYFWRQGANGAIFSDGVANQRFWPQQPIIYEGFLFAAMTRVEGGADEIGTALARVSNPLDTPDQWQVEYFDLASLSGLGKGTVVVDNYAYLFGNAGQAVITRLPLDELIKPAAVPAALLEYLASDGQWKKGLVTDDAKKLGFNANVGTSFRYLRGAKKWLVLFTNTSGWPSATISVSTAPELVGPWAKPVNVYEVPEMTVGSPEYEQDNVCYAGIEHAESNPDSETQLLFSYTCNSFVLAKQLANLGLYLPKIVKLTNPVAN